MCRCRRCLPVSLPCSPARPAHAATPAGPALHRAGSLQRQRSPPPAFTLALAQGHPPALLHAHLPAIKPPPPGAPPGMPSAPRPRPAASWGNPAPPMVAPPPGMPPGMLPGGPAGAQRSRPEPDMHLAPPAKRIHAAGELGGQPPPAAGQGCRRQGWW
jgi:hypothetical protein